MPQYSFISTNCYKIICSDLSIERNHNSQDLGGFSNFPVCLDLAICYLDFPSFDYSIGLLPGVLPGLLPGVFAYQLSNFVVTFHSNRYAQLFHCHGNEL